MTKRDVSSTHPKLSSYDLWRYRIIFVLSLVALACAYWVLNVSYWQHTALLKDGNVAGDQLRSCGLSAVGKEASHAQH